MKKLFTILLITGLISCTNQFKKGEAEFKNTNYEEAKLSYLKVESSNENFQKAQQRLIEIDSIIVKIKFDSAFTAFEKGDFKQAKVLFLQIETVVDQQKRVQEILSKIDSIENVQTNLTEIELKKELKIAKTNFSKLFKELLAFKNKSDFHENGFAKNSKYNRWLTDVQKLKDTPTEKVLFKLGLLPGDLEMLGNEYMNSKGKETEYSIWTKKTINEGLNK